MSALVSTQKNLRWCNPLNKIESSEINADEGTSGHGIVLCIISRIILNFVIFEIYSSFLVTDSRKNLLVCIVMCVTPFVVLIIKWFCFVFREMIEKGEGINIIVYIVFKGDWLPECVNEMCFYMSAIFGDWLGEGCVCV